MASSKMDQISSYQAMSRQKSAITVTTFPQDKGWVIHVAVPSKVPASDRLKVIEWIRSYRNQIKSQHPMWDASFRSGDNIYALVIKPASCEDDMKNLAREKADKLLGFIMNSYATG
jgi:hypothetical protein